MKNICLNILSYVGISILLIVGTYEAWKEGNRVIALITAFVAIMMIWHAVENYKQLNKQTT